MRSLLLLPLLLAPALRAQAPATGLGATSQTSALLLIEGTSQALQVTQAWRKAVPFLPPLPDDRFQGEIVLRDVTGNATWRQRLDLSDFVFAGGRDEVTGDVVRKNRIAVLAKIPDLGQRLGSLHIRVRQGQVWTEVGKLGAAALEQLMTPRFQPMVATVKTHLKNGDPKNRYDIVILGDGYQATEQTHFYADVDKWMNNLFAKEPYKTYKPFFNVHSVFNPSKESGADHPDRTPPIVKDTVYDASYNTGGTPRCLYIKNGAQALRDAALAPDVEGRVVVFVNDSRYGGCAGTYAVSYNGSSGPEVQSHEFGHSYGRLADEYDYGRSGTYTGPEPAQANVTADKTGKAKWPLWLGYKGIATYEGARYYKTGLWRSESNCLMRALGIPLCHVCIEEISKQGYATVNPIEGATPAPGPISVTVPATKTLSFTNLVPGGGKIEWKAGSQVLQSGGTSFTVDGTRLPLGTYDLDLVVTDTTSMVRKGPPVRKATWKLTVIDPNAADLAIKSLTLPASAANGSKIDIVTVLENRGKTTTSSCQLEHFAANGSVATPANTFLGSVAVPAIGPGKSLQIKHSIAIPHHLLQGTITVLVDADRAGSLREGSRTNNSTSKAITMTAPSGCPTSLEFRDPMVWPADISSLSLSGAGFASLSVTSACHKGDWAMVLWSTLGTSPGFTFGGVSIPLTLDPIATPFSIANANTGPFYLFFTRLDGNGQTSPLIVLGEPYAIKPFSSYFAAVILKSDLSAVLKASNPIQLDFVK